eukprot:29273-Pelagomonas_calceolata.AAC.7
MPTNCVRSQTHTYTHTHTPAQQAALCFGRPCGCSPPVSHPIGFLISEALREASLVPTLLPPPPCTPLAPSSPLLSSV